MLFAPCGFNSTLALLQYEGFFNEEESAAVMFDATATVLAWDCKAPAILRFDARARTQ